MPRRVKGPDGVVRSFPDDATDDEIAAALEPPSTPRRNVMEQMGSADPAFGGLPYIQEHPASPEQGRSDAMMLASIPAFGALGATRLLPGLAGRIGAAINSPVGVGGTMAAIDLARGKDPLSAAQTGLEWGIGLKVAPSVMGAVLGRGSGAKLAFLLKKLGVLGSEERAAAAMASEKAAAEVAAARSMVNSGSAPSRVVPIRPNVNVSTAAPPAPRPVSTGTVPVGSVPINPSLRVPVRPAPVAAPVVAEAAAPVAEEVAVAKAANPRVPRAPKAKPTAPAQSEMEDQLAKSLELAKNRVAGKPFRVGTAAPQAPKLPNAEELQSFVLEKYGQGMSKPQIVNSIKDVYGLPDVPGPRGKAIGYWKDAVDLILGGLVGVR